MLISVLTPTFDRAHTLGDTYAGLLAQGVDLEWIVVDDGSTDGTRDLLAQLRGQAPFPLRYLWQEHAGVHAARNTGARAARGELVALLDSDDILADHALDRVAAEWSRLTGRNRYTGISGLCVDETGRLVGDRFPADVVDTTWQEMTYGHRVRGEKFMVIRADLLRTYQFRTDPPGFFGESTLWRTLGRRYLTRHVNDVLRVYRIADPSRICRRPFGDVAWISAIAGTDMLNEDITWLTSDPAGFARAAAHLSRALFHLRVSPWRQPQRLHTLRARVLLSAALPIGWSLYHRDTGVSRKKRTAVSEHA